MLSKLTQTRYDYQSTRVQSLTHSDKLRLDQEQQNRKPFDLREEYFKLAQPDQAEPSKFGHVADQDPPSEKVAKKQKRLANWNDWDGNQIRVPRPPGAPEWGGVDPREQSPEIGTRLV